MKIFFPLEVFYPSQAGGPANTIYWFTKNLIKYGFNISIVATDKGIQDDVLLDKWLVTDEIKTIYVKTRFLNFPLKQTIISLFHFHKADIVHLSSFFYPAVFITAFAARVLRKKIAWSARGELDTQALNHSKWRKKPVLWCIKTFIGQYPVFHSTCPEETIYIKNVFGVNSKVVEIPNYIEVPVAVERDAKQYILYIGRIHPKKAIDNLIRAVNISEKFKNSDYVLKIAGKGKPEFESDLQELVAVLKLSNKIEFVGQIEGEEKQQFLADAFWTIMPSHTENFGIVVLESLAQSTPVIASKGSPWQILENEKIGFWTENSPENLAKIIDKILDMSSNEYESYRKKSRKIVERKFDVEENINVWVDFYNNLQHF